MCSWNKSSNSIKVREIPALTGKELSKGECPKPEQLCVPFPFYPFLRRRWDFSG